MRFIRSFNDWELEETQRFISMINSRRTTRRERDKKFWMMDKYEQYIVKACYRQLEGECSNIISEGLVWNSCIPPKVSVFLWEVWWGKVLTLNQLKKKRGFQLTSRCPLCHKDEESLEHLLIHCPTVWGIWVAIISLLGMDWVSPLPAKDLMMEWKAFPVRKKARKLWKTILSSLF